MKTRNDSNDGIFCPFAIRCAALFMGALFVWCAADKILHYGRYLTTITSISGFTRVAAQWMAPSSIAFEACIGLGLLFRAPRRAARAAVAFLIAVSAISATHTIFGTPEIGSAWYTVTMAPTTGMYVLQNLVLLVIAGILSRSVMPADPSSP